MNITEITQLKQHAQHNTYIPHGDIATVDCVLGFSFGYIETSQGAKPGKSNEQLARYIELTFPNTPLILQHEIDDALQHCAAELVIREHRTKGEYLGSPEIAQQARLFMHQQGWKTAAIVTHPAMEARNDALCRKLGIITVAPPGLETIEYDLQSAQPWTRDKARWWAREDGVIDRGINEGWL